MKEARPLYFVSVATKQEMTMTAKERKDAFKMWMRQQEKPNGGRRFGDETSSDYPARLQNKRDLVRLAKGRISENVFTISDYKIVSALHTLMDAAASCVPNDQKARYQDFKTALQAYKQFLREMTR